MLGTLIRYFRINKAIGAAEQMLREFIASEAMFRAIPSSIYEDPYVWGYLGSVTMHWLDLVYAESIPYEFSIDEKARIARGATVALASMSMKRYAVIKDTLAGEDSLEGMRQARKMIGVMYGKLGAADDPEIASLLKDASKLAPDESPAGFAAGMLKSHHLGRRIDSILAVTSRAGTV